MASTYHGDVRPRGVTVLSVVWFLAAALNFVVGLGAALGGNAILGGLEGFASALTGGFLAFAGWALVVLGLLQLGIGVALWTLRPWARTAAIFFAVLGLVNFPVGTILSAIVLVYLFQPEVRDAFQPGPSPVARRLPARR